MEYQELVQKRKEAFSGSTIVTDWQIAAYKLGADDYRDNNKLVLPDIEDVSAHVHYAWIQSKQKQGVVSRLAEDGEELMVPYQSLSEKVKDLDRSSVLAVYKAIEDAMQEDASFPTTKGKESRE